MSTALADDLDALETALVDEGAAIAAHDIAAIEDALGRKRSAVARLALHGPVTDPDTTGRLLQLKALAEGIEARVNIALDATERRIHALVDGTPRSTTYAPDGRLATRVAAAILGTA